MALATWWDGDSLSNLSPLAGFSAGLAHDDQTLAHLNNLTLAEVHRRWRRAGLERANEGPMLGCLCLAADRSGK